MKKDEINIENYKEIIELVSEEIHNHWMIWAKELLKSESNISEERRIRWQSECFMNYEDLSEEMKNLDRRFAKRIISKFKTKKT
jgi:hypothetical protein